MENDRVKYLIDHFLHLVPLETKAKLKYPYLSEHEIKEEKHRIAKYLIKNYKDKIIINDCPKCRKLARTQEAKKCRHCEHDWH